MGLRNPWSRQCDGDRGETRHRRMGEGQSGMVWMGVEPIGCGAAGLKVGLALNGRARAVRLEAGKAWRGWSGAGQVAECREGG